MKLGSEDDMTPEFIAGSDTHTKAEKLEMLEKMRREALSSRESGEPSQGGTRIASIDRAIAQVKADDRDGPGIASGRATSA